MLWASSHVPGSPGGGVFRLVPDFGPVPAALGLVPCSEGLTSVVMQGGTAGPACPTLHRTSPIHSTQKEGIAPSIKALGTYSQ